jgi:antitoxin VapB
MTRVRIFQSGKSQAVRQPKELRVDSQEVEIFRRCREIVLPEPEVNLARAFELLSSLPDDFLLDRGQELPQVRDEL